MRSKNLFFDHLWVELGGKIVDLAISMVLQDIEVSVPIVLDINAVTLQRYECEYGVANGESLDLEAQNVIRVSFQFYMDSFTGSRNGLWDVVNIAIINNADINELRSK